MRKTIYILLLGVVFSGLVSCNDFLDEIPDKRTEIKSQDDVKNLLVSAYPNASFYYLCEMASDNTDETEGGSWEFDVLQREAFSWGKITEAGMDSPHHIWEECYTAISAANVAIEFIENSSQPESMNAQLGEALICRAYSHFILVNLFSKQYGSTSDNDLGIPYITQPETVVNPSRERGTVAKVYENILDDLTKGLPLIDNNSYVIPKYHFNKDAAYAFAARVYLYLGEMDEVIKYADKVLGTGTPSKLRDWAYSGSLGVNYDFQTNEYINVDNPATLLNVSSSSFWGVIGGPYALGRRYSHNERISSSETVETQTPWGNMGNPDFVYQGTLTNADLNKVVVRKVGYYYKALDPIAGTGFAYIINVPFTTDELLLCRAEAYIRTKKYDKAVDDLNAFMMNYTIGTAVTVDDITNFYETLSFYTPTAPTPKKKINPDFVIESGDQENMTQCLLHLRRILTIHEGLRWFDIKRYGIEIYRRKVSDEITETDFLPADDLRRVFQIPADVISGGLEPNPR